MVDEGGDEMTRAEAVEAFHVASRAFCVISMKIQNQLHTIEKPSARVQLLEAMGKLRKQPIGPASNPLLVASHWRLGDRAYFPLPQQECALIGDVMQRKSGELYWRMVTKNGWHRRAEFCCDADAWYWID